jgi:hypothetical protein
MTAVASLVRLTGSKLLSCCTTITYGCNDKIQELTKGIAISVTCCSMLMKTTEAGSIEK